MRARRTAGQVAAMLEAESLWEAAVSGTGMEMAAALGTGMASLWAAALETRVASLWAAGLGMGADDEDGGAGRPE